MAGRIPQSFIDEVLARTDLVELIGARVQLKRSGRNYSGLCPFHHEKSPSFSVNAERQFYHCFGCKASGNAVKFLMEHDHLDFIEAIEHLAAAQGMEVPREQGVASQDEQQRRVQKELQASRLRWMQVAAQYFQQALATAPAASQYFHQRGLSEDIIERFALGYAPDGWDGLKQYLAGQGMPEAQQLELGLLAEKEDTGRTYDRFRHRVMFPIRNVRGEVIGFGGRVLDDSKPKYLNSPETPLFHKGQELYGLYEARQHSGRLDRLLVVEGYMDVVALAQQGITWAVATLGTATTPDHLRRIFRLVNEVVFCFDGDAAGKQAAIKALEAVLPLMEDGRHARFLFLPEGEDPDSLVRKEKAALFEQRVGQAQPLAEFLLAHLRKGLNLALMDDQAHLAQLARPYLKALPTGLLRRRLLASLVQLTGLNDDDLLASGGSSQSQAVVAPVAAARPGTKNTRLALSLMERLLRLCVRYPELITLLPDNLPWQQDEAGQLLDKVRRSLPAKSPVTTQVLLSYWTGTLEGEALLQRGRLALQLDRTTAEVEVRAICARLQQQQREAEWLAAYDALLSLSRERRQAGGSLTAEESQQLQDLLRSDPRRRAVD